ncbi:hypothetical protein CY0110_11502 [Crocosphaera chwakensis CCY0110]|uniref:Pentapeptide repeat-containing protein n=2 Tax=Crocosphaera TaxID=263510 RepID=A3IQH1_9CHRO|nr:hypothetical protein CY0110_11502 [Crocosphaera chwakensis CCY0110]
MGTEYPGDIDEIFNGVNFRNANMANSILTQIWLINADLSSINLEGADLRGSLLLNAKLRNANLRGSDLTGADLTDADLTNADLTNADLRYTILVGANLRGADLTGIITQSNHFDSSIFHLTTMPNGTIESSSSKVIDATELLGRYAEGERYFEEFILYRADLSGADLRSLEWGGRFTHVNFSRANLSHASVWPTRFIFCNLSGAILNRCYLGSAVIAFSDLRGATGEMIDCDALRLIDVNWQGANLTSTCGNGKFSPSCYNSIREDGSFVNGWS